MAAPTKAPARTYELMILSETSTTVSLIPTCAYIKETSSDNEARAAEPMAKPLPIAAVVLPTESSLSVICLTSGASLLISEMPPALSAIGP